MALTIAAARLHLSIVPVRTAGVDHERQECVSLARVSKRQSIMVGRGLGLD